MPQARSFARELRAAAAEEAAEEAAAEAAAEEVEAAEAAEEVVLHKTSVMR